jgi:hypothetical protein
MDDQGLAEIRPAYRRLRSGLAETDTALEKLTRDRARFQGLIEGLEELYPNLAEEGDQEEADQDEVSAPMSESASKLPPEDGIPRGKRAVTQILSRNAGRWFTAQDILAEMIKYGWTPRSESTEHALRAVRTSIGRAVDSGEVESKPVDGRTLAYRHRFGSQLAEEGVK